jgi:hypothetical protein
MQPAADFAMAAACIGSSQKSHRSVAETRTARGQGEVEFPTVSFGFGGSIGPTVVRRIQGTATMLSRRLSVRGLARILLPICEAFVVGAAPGGIRSGLNAAVASSDKSSKKNGCAVLLGIF